MRDSGLKTFETRLARIDRIHAAGGAFEASGALGRSYFDSVRPKERKAFPLRGLALFLGGVLLFKAAILAKVGAGVYDSRVGELALGNWAEQIGAWVLKADPATQWLAGVLHGLLF